MDAIDLAYAPVETGRDPKTLPFPTRSPMHYCLECAWCNAAAKGMADSTEASEIGRRIDGEEAADGLDCWCGHTEAECRMFDAEEHDEDCHTCTGLDEDHWRER